jgi:hypothetical protein
LPKANSATIASVSRSTNLKCDFISAPPCDSPGRAMHFRFGEAAG